MKKRIFTLLLVTALLFALCLSFSACSHKKYTVSFDTDGAGEIKSVKISSLTELEMPADPVKDGYTFAYWEYPDTEYCDSEGRLTRDITITARYATSDGFVFAKNEGGASYNLLSYMGDAYAVTIPSVHNGLPVSSFTAYAFNCNLSLVSLTIPESITEIRWGTALNAGPICPRLSEIVNRSSVKLSHKTLEMHSGESKLLNKNDFLFYEVDGTVYLVGYCGSAIDITLPENYEGRSYKIREYAFSETMPMTLIFQAGTGTPAEPLHTLNSVIIPDGVAEIGDGAFFGCKQLSSIRLPSTLEYLGTNVFENCTALSFTKYDGADYLGNADDPYLILYKANEDIEELHTHEDTRVIYHGAARKLGKLEALTLPEGLVQIGDGAFGECNGVSSVTLPDGLRYLGENAFSRNTVLETSDTAQYFRSISGVLYNYPTTELLHVPKSTKTVQIPEGVTALAQNAFKGCSFLTSVTIPASVREISPSAFSGCDQLERVVFEATDGWAAYKKNTAVSMLPLGGSLANSTVIGSYEAVLVPGGTSSSVTLTPSEGYVTIAPGTNDLIFSSGMDTVTEIVLPNAIYTFSAIESTFSAYKEPAVKLDGEGVGIDVTDEVQNAVYLQKEYINYIFKRK